MRPASIPRAALASTSVRRLVVGDRCGALAMACRFIRLVVWLRAFSYRLLLGWRGAADGSRQIRLGGSTGGARSQCRIGTVPGTRRAGCVPKSANRIFACGRLRRRLDCHRVATRPFVKRLSDESHRHLLDPFRGHDSDSGGDRGLRPQLRHHFGGGGPGPLVREPDRLGRRESTGNGDKLARVSRDDPCTGGDLDWRNGSPCGATPYRAGRRQASNHPGQYSAATKMEWRCTTGIYGKTSAHDSGRATRLLQPRYLAGNSGALRHQQ